MAEGTKRAPGDPLGPKNRSAMAPIGESPASRRGVLFGPHVGGPSNFGVEDVAVELPLAIDLL